MAIQTGLVAYYKMDTGALTTDSSGNGYTLTNVNTVAEGAAKMGTTSADFGSTNTTKRFYVNNGMGMTYSSTRTIAFWFNPSANPATGTNMKLFWFMFGTNPGNYSIVYYGKISGGVYQIANQETYNVQLTVGTWYHIVLVHNHGANTMKTYLNGSLIISAASFSGNYTAYTTGLAVGNDSVPSAGTFTKGMEDEFAVWNRALDTTEISYLYNFNGGRQYPLSNIVN